MAQTTTQSSASFLPEYQEEYLKDLLASARARAGEPTFIPERQVAELTPGQRQAIELGYQGVGAYMPMMQAGEQTLGQGVGAYMESAPLLQSSVGAYDPRSYQEFMDPYTEEVIDQTQRDIMRQAEMQEQRLGAQAVQAGAFGGSREGVAQAELGRAALEQAARTGAGLRSAGFNQAQQSAQNAFQNQMARQQSAAQLFQGLGSGLGKAGLSQAALGESAQAAQQRDINALLSLGGLEQAQQQSMFDASRQTALERQYEPYQRISFMSDVFRGVPSTQSTIASTTAPSPSTISQIAGLGVGLSGLSQSGVFGEQGILGALGMN